MYCTKCGKKNNDKHKFCEGCGAPLTGGAPVTIWNKVIIAIIALAVVAIVGAGIYFVNSLRTSKQDEAEDFYEEDETVDEKTADEEDDDIDTEDEEETIEEIEDTVEAETVDYASLYLKCIDKYFVKYEVDREDIAGAGFIYLNDDDIPELVLLGSYEAMGNTFFTCDEEGNTDEFISSRLGYSYIERGNKLNNSGGHMGYYFDNIYTIEDGKWTCIEAGNYEENMDPDTYEIDGYTYYWSDEEIDSETYTKNVAKYYDSLNAKSLDYENMLSLDEIINELETGDIEPSPTKDLYGTDSKEIHSYELVKGATDWYSAFNDSSEKGGYLVRINSKAEFDYICNMIDDEDMTDYVYYISGERDWGDTSHYRWLMDDYRFEKAEIDTDAELSKLWLPGEPSYTGVDFDGNTVEETYMCMFYAKKADGFCFNDITDDISSVYGSKLAYIVEYE